MRRCRRRRSDVGASTHQKVVRCTAAPAAAATTTTTTKAFVFRWLGFPWLALSLLWSTTLWKPCTIIMTEAINPRPPRSHTTTQNGDNSDDSIPDVLILIATQSFTGEELVEDILLERLLDHDWTVQVHLVDEAPFLDWTGLYTQQGVVNNDIDDHDDNNNMDDDKIVSSSSSSSTIFNLTRYARSLLVVASTYADGEPPNHALEFAQWLSSTTTTTSSSSIQAPTAPPFSVFALGDSTYQHYCAFGEYVDAHLSRTHRAIPLVPLHRGDAHVGNQAMVFADWTNQVIRALQTQILPASFANPDGSLSSSQQQPQRPPRLASSTGADWRRSAILATASSSNILLETIPLLSTTTRTTTPNNHQTVHNNNENNVTPTMSSSTNITSRHVLHVTIQLVDTKAYDWLQPGDHAGIYPRNERELVDRTLAWLQIPHPNTMTTTILEKEASSSSNSGSSWMPREILATEFLSSHVDLAGRATSSTLRALLPFVGTLELRALARQLTMVNTTTTSTTTTTGSTATKKSPNEHDSVTSMTMTAFDQWVAGRWLTKFDLAVLFECRPSLQALARAIGPLQPRLYSIATVNHHHRPHHNRDEDNRESTNTTTTIGLCISMAQGGLCSNYLAQLQSGDALTMFFRKSKFHFLTDGTNNEDNPNVPVPSQHVEYEILHTGTEDGSGENVRNKHNQWTPSCLIGAGSGVGPYVGFLEREMQRYQNDTFPLKHIRLFLGFRSPSDIIYEEKLDNFIKSGAHGHFAYSRIFGQPKVHAQDLVAMEAPRMWQDLYHRRGRVYVCGRLELCTDVRQALMDVARTEGKLSDQESLTWVQNLEKENRLLTDCWSVDDPFAKRVFHVEPLEPPSIPRLERHRAFEEPPSESCTTSDPVDLSGIPEWPSYLRLVASGELQRRIDKATNMYTACVSCGRFCEVNRTSPDHADWGECRVGTRAIVYAADAHFGEEPCLKGTHGSGTIFFGACNLKCVYCQNWQLSAMDRGEVVTPHRLAEMMLGLQERGCHNINFVSPTHNVLAVLESTLIAAQNGLRLPIVWNTGGYDSVASLRLLEGVVDIYMPDSKYASRKVARKLSKIDNYPEINQAAIKEMFRQVGDLQINPRTGLAWRGLLIRHLILPEGYGGTSDVAAFLAKEIGVNTFTHVMDYYRPEFQASDDTKFGINRQPSIAELQDAHRQARCANLQRIYGEERNCITSDGRDINECLCPTDNGDGR